MILTASALAPLPVAILHATFHHHAAGIGVLLGTAVLAAGLTARRPRLRTT